MTPTDGRKAEKEFEQRRAGSLPQDDAADEKYLAGLVIVDLSGVGVLPPARALTEAERLIKRQGRELTLRPLEIMRPEVYAEKQAARTAMERSRRLVKAEKARSEARLAEAEAARWRE